MTYRKPKNIILRMTLILILVGIFVWSYIQFFANYKKVELSRKMIEALLENKTDLAKDYAKQLGFVQENLDRTEDFLKDIKDKNMKLREKIKLLDQLNDMEREIGRLREENVLIHKQMVEASYEFTSDDTAGFKFDTVILPSIASPVPFTGLTWKPWKE